MNFEGINNSSQILTDYVGIMNEQCVGLKYNEMVSKLSETIPDIKNQSLNVKYSDKGALGKLVEKVLFGNNPNSNSKPDLDNGYDIKVTKFKKNKNNGFYNAKERLCITNVGSTSDYNTLTHLSDCNTLEDTKCFPKIRKFVLLVFSNNSSISECIFLGAVIYNYDMLPIFKNQIRCDFDNIKEKIRNKTVSQKGQLYLHIHPHGSKNSKTRALGFKNKFVTTLFGTLHSNYTVEKIGNSIVIKPNDTLV